MENVSHKRVIRALNFEKPDRVPHYDDYLDKFIEKWKMEKRLGKDGGVILAAHSIGPDIPIENYDWAIEAYRKWR